MSSVLLIGRSDLLTDTHRAILEQAAYQVQTAGSESEVVSLLSRQSFDLVEILFTVPMKERHRLAAVIKRMVPLAKIFVVHSSGHCADCQADGWIDSRNGPAQILAAIQDLMLPKTIVGSVNAPAKAMSNTA